MSSTDDLALAYTADTRQTLLRVNVKLAVNSKKKRSLTLRLMALLKYLTHHSHMKTFLPARNSMRPSIPLWKSAASATESTNLYSSIQLLYIVSCSKMLVVQHVKDPQQYSTQSSHLKNNKTFVWALLNKLRSPEYSLLYNWIVDSSGHAPTLNTVIYMCWTLSSTFPQTSTEVFESILTGHMTTWHHSHGAENLEWMLKSTQNIIIIE